jgi:hypothetical protein
MSRYAKINLNNIVEQVIICDESNISLFTGNYIKESTETLEANVGDTWDSENNKFIPPKPYDSWLLDENFSWSAPVSQTVPNSYWDEETGSWIETVLINE